MRIMPQQMTARHISMIKAAVSRDKRLTLKDALKDIYTHKSALFKINNTLYTLQINGQALHIAQLAGDLVDIKAIHATICSMCIEMGKTRIELNGRKGWTRALKPLGYKPAGNLLRYTL